MPGRNKCHSELTLPALLFFQILWIIPQKAVRWVLVMIALAISGSVLAMTFWPAVREDNRRIALATIVTIVLLHMLLSVGCLVRSHSDALLVCFRCHAKTSNCQTPWFFKSWLPGINIVLNRLCRMRNNSHENLVVISEFT